MEAKAKQAHDNLLTLWNTTDIPLKCSKRWNEWSSRVREDFLRRAKKAILATSVSSFPKNQRSEWGETIKFCIDDVFELSLSLTDKAWESEHGFGYVIKNIVDGQEKTLNLDTFKSIAEKGITEMKEKDQKFASSGSDDLHLSNVLKVRSTYSAIWAHYIISKLSQD